jgi:hypothetical protein
MIVVNLNQLRGKKNKIDVLDKIQVLGFVIMVLHVK